MQPVRILTGFNANRTEHSLGAAIFFMLTIITLFVAAQYAFLQTYVLDIEILISLILAGFCLIEMILAAIAIKKFKKNDANLN